MNPSRPYVRRTSRGALCSALFALLLASAVPEAHAQGERVGQIEEMKQGEESVESADGVRLTATPAYTRKPARQRDALHVRELVELLEPYYVRARLDYGALQSEVIVGSTGAQVAAIELQRRGAYEILPNRVDPLSGLELRIRHGVVVIEHAAGRLDAWVSNTLTRIFGTRVLFVADSTSASALLYLREGHIGFPDYGMEVREPGSTWQLRDGVAPERIVLPATARRQLQRESDFLAETLWSGLQPIEGHPRPPRPFYTKPGFYLPAAGAVLIGAGVILLATGGDDGDRVSGEAMIFIPN